MKIIYSLQYNGRGFTKLKFQINFIIFGSHYQNLLNLKRLNRQTYTQQREATPTKLKSVALTLTWLRHVQSYYCVHTKFFLLA